MTLRLAEGDHPSNSALRDVRYHNNTKLQRS